MTSGAVPTRALVLGGAGFIGSHVAAALVRRHVAVTVLDGFLPEGGARTTNLADVAGRIQMIRSRVEDCADLDAVVGEATVVIDCLGLAAHHIGMAEPMRDLELNLRSHLVVIESLRRVRGRRVVYLGSRGQYGRPTGGTVTEDTAQVPVDPQGVHKLAAESLYRIYAERGELEAVSLRLSNTFGEHQRTTGGDLGLVGGFIRDLLAGRTVQVFGDSGRTKALLYVRDAAEITVETALGLPVERFAAFNVAGTEVTLQQLLDLLVTETGSGAWTVAPFPEHVRQMDSGDAPYSDARLAQALGALPRTDVHDALRTTVAYFKGVGRELVG
jgi:nucleoside-diphosphate-sugar epimerase